MLLILLLSHYLPYLGGRTCIPVQRGTGLVSEGGTLQCGESNKPTI